LRLFAHIFVSTALIYFLTNSLFFQAFLILIHIICTHEQDFRFGFSRVSTLVAESENGKFTESPPHRQQLAFPPALGLKSSCVIREFRTFAPSSPAYLCIFAFFFTSPSAFWFFVNGSLDSNS